jgi:hypothetical protein
MMNEELLNGQELTSLHQGLQADLIAKHCTGIEERIQRAQSRNEAITIVQETCARFEKECPSDLFRRGLVLHVQEMLERYWKDS